MTSAYGRTVRALLTVRGVNPQADLPMRITGSLYWLSVLGVRPDRRPSKRVVNTLLNSYGLPLASPDEDRRSVTSSKRTMSSVALGAPSSLAKRTKLNERVAASQPLVHTAVIAASAVHIVAEVGSVARAYALGERGD